jgi:biopolymer transport protein ExbD
MKCLLYVCLIALLAAAVVHVVERSAEASQQPAQVLQQGVSVKMVDATHAQPMPEADNADACIVTVTADGQLYFGVDPATPAALRERMIRTPHKHGQRVYIKADARASFASVQKALDAASAAEIESPVLLVSQQSSTKPGTIIAPEGLEILLDGANSGAKSTVELNYSAQGSPNLRIGDQTIPLADLRDRIHQVVQNQKEKTILLRADGRSAFGDVAQVIDACRAAGASVVVATPVV